MAGDDFDRCVLINCPFDKSFDPILQSVLFCIAYLGMTPRIARERSDSGENRLEKIKVLIRKLRYSIHDLSRSRATKTGGHARHNMPFELGMDYGCRQFAGDHRAGKMFLVMADRPYDYRISLSDMAGCDIESHGGKYENAMQKVVDWLVNEANPRRSAPPGVIIDRYADFQTWHYEQRLAEGWTKDIELYPTKPLLGSMMTGLAAGEPTPVAASASRA